VSESQIIKQGVVDYLLSENVPRQSKSQAGDPKLVTLFAGTHLWALRQTCGPEVRSWPSSHGLPWVWLIVSNSVLW
jgi:hypothetical protein